MPPTHRICLQSWELVQTFRGAVVPRAGETIVLGQEESETKYSVTSVMYKRAPGGDLVATVFVAPAAQPPKAL